MQHDTIAPRILGLGFTVFLAAFLTARPAISQSTKPVVYAGTATGAVHCIDVFEGTLEWTSAVTGAVEIVAASKLGDYILVATTTEVQLLDSSGAQVGASIALGVPARDEVEISQVAIDENGEYFAAAHNDGTVRLYLRQPAGTLLEVFSHAFPATSVEMSWNGEHLVAGGPTGVAKWDVGVNGAWDSTDATPRWTSLLAGGGAYTVDMSHGDLTGNFFVAAGSDVGANSGSYALWDASGTGTPIWTGLNPKGGQISVALSPRGDRMVAANHDPTDTAGSILESFSDLTDGSPGWQSSDSTPTWSYEASAGTADDCRTLEFKPSADARDFVSGGAGAFVFTEHRVFSPIPTWIGIPEGEVSDSAFIALDCDHSRVVACDRTIAEVHIYATGTTLADHIVPTSGNCTSVSGPAAFSISPDRYCVGAPNSVGPGATIDAAGSCVLQHNSVELLATGVVPGMFGLFFFGLAPDQVPFGEGFLCTAGQIFRLDPPILVDGSGGVSRMVDLTAPPAAGTITFGVTSYFQFWYRDPGGGPAGFNLSDGISILWR